MQAGLRALDIPFELAPRLVRGFDYYTATTFEFQSDALDGAQNAVGGGGRYDGLAEEMGGPPTPGIGFGTGLERIVLALEASGVPAPAAPTEVFVVDGLGGEGGTTVGGLVETLRTEGFAVDRAYGGRSVKAQWKAADRSGARGRGDGRTRRARPRRGRGEGPRDGHAGGGAADRVGGLVGGPQRWRETVSLGPLGVIVR